jgi:hypothetical protein
MNEKDNNAFGPLMNINCFHVDVQEMIQQELNGVFEKNEYLMQKL